MQGGKFQQSRHTLYDRHGTRVAHDATAAQVASNKGGGVRTKMVSPCSFTQHGGDEVSGAPTYPDPREVWTGPTAIASMSSRYCVLTRYLHVTSYLFHIPPQLLRLLRCTTRPRTDNLA